MFAAVPRPWGHWKGRGSEAELLAWGGGGGEGLGRPEVRPDVEARGFQRKQDINAPYLAKVDTEHRLSQRP